MSHSLAGLLLLGLLSVATSALGQDAPPTGSEDVGSDEDARLHFELGRRAYARADYETALAEFQQSYAFSSRPELHYNLFLVFHELERDDEAVVELRAFLETVEDDEMRSQLEARLSRIEASLAARRAGEAHDEAEETEATPADTIDIGEEVVLAPPPRAGEELTIAGATTLGAGALSLIAFGVLGALALNEREALEGRCAPSCSAADTASGRDLALGADVTLGIGVALAAAGGVLLGIGLAQASESGIASAPPTVTVLAGPTGATVVVAGSL